MKKLLSIIIVMSMTFLCSVTAITAAAENAVSLMSEDDYIVDFPDSVLKEYMVLNYDANGDGQIQKSELRIDSDRRKIYIDLSNSNVVSTKGLEEIAPKMGINYKPSVTFKFDNSKIKDVAPLFEAIVNNDEAIFNISLNNNPQLTNEDFYQIPVASSNAKEDIVLEMKNTSVDDLSRLEGYRIVKFKFSNKMSKGFSGEYLDTVEISGEGGPGLITLLENAPNIRYLTIDSGNYINHMKHLGNLADLTIYGNYGFSNDDLAVFLEKDLTNITSIDFYNTQITDLSAFRGKVFDHMVFFEIKGPQSLITDITPLRDIVMQSKLGNKTFYIYFDYDGTSFQDVMVDGKTLGDHLLSQLPSIQKANVVYDMDIRHCRVTDLTPLNDVSKSNFRVSVQENWIAFSYKNNKKIYDDTIKAGSPFYYYGRANKGVAKSSYSDENSSSLSFDSSFNKKSYAYGDVITLTAAVTNSGIVSENVDIYFDIGDIEDYDEINIVNGDLHQRVTDIAPGQTVKKTVSFSISNKTKKTLESYMLFCKDSTPIAFISTPGISLRDDVSFWTVKTAYCNIPLRINGLCSADMKNVQIQTSDGEVIENIDDYSGGTGFRADIMIPEKYWPAVNSTKIISLKAVVTDENDKTYSSPVKDITLRNPEFESTLTIEDAHYSVYGSSHQYTLTEPSIMYYGNRAIIRTKFSGIDPSEIARAELVVNNRTLRMSPYVDGKYAGYYGTMVPMNLPEDYFDIILRVTTKSGDVLETLAGYGRILIDPSGIITDPNGDPIEGVKVTLQKLQDDGSWADWDAENYLQTNPVYTNEEGYYGWDVLEGTYRIIAEKEGYVTKVVERYYSRDQGEETEITVLPPRMDVDFSMEYADPENPPLKPMTIEEAKKALEAAVSGLKLSASANETDVTSKLMGDLTENMYVSFKSGTYVKAESTDTTEGSITGTLILENIWRDESQEISINIPLETIKATEFIDVFDNFTDKLMIEKIYGDNENVNLEISPKNNSDLPELKLYKALYTSEGILKKVDIVNAESVNGKTVISIEKPIVGENETFKLMLWTNEHIPVIEVIHNDTVGFFK